MVWCQQLRWGSKCSGQKQCWQLSCKTQVGRTVSPSYVCICVCVPLLEQSFQSLSTSSAASKDGSLSSRRGLELHHVSEVDQPVSAHGGGFIHSPLFPQDCLGLCHSVWSLNKSQIRKGQHSARTVSPTVIWIKKHTKLASGARALDGIMWVFSSSYTGLFSSLNLWMGKLLHHPLFTFVQFEKVNAASASTSWQNRWPMTSRGRHKMLQNEVLRLHKSTAKLFIDNI